MWLLHQPASSDCFENDRNTLPHADTHRRQTKTHLLLVHGMQQRRGNAGPTGPEWVTNCQAAPMDIHLLTIDSKLIEASQHLGSKRFIEFNQADVAL